MLCEDSSDDNVLIELKVADELCRGKQVSEGASEAGAISRCKSGPGKA
jgi:hypothetical protein